jgi:hypothetical protein
MNLLFVLIYLQFVEAIHNRFLDVKIEQPKKKSLEEQIYDRWGDEAVEKLSS